METLIQSLMEQHQLSRKDAENAMAMVVTYLKEKNPHLQQLIHSALDDGRATEEPDGEA